MQGLYSVPWITYQVQLQKWCCQSADGNLLYSHSSGITRLWPAWLASRYRVLYICNIYQVREQSVCWANASMRIHQLRSFVVSFGQLCFNRIAISNTGEIDQYINALLGCGPEVLFNKFSSLRNLQVSSFVFFPFHSFGLCRPCRCLKFSFFQQSFSSFFLNCLLSLTIVLFKCFFLSTSTSNLKFLFLTKTNCCT